MVLRQCLACNILVGNHKNELLESCSRAAVNDYYDLFPAVHYKFISVTWCFEILNSLARLRPALYEASGILLRLNTAAEIAVRFARSIDAADAVVMRHFRAESHSAVFITTTEFIHFIKVLELNRLVRCAIKVITNACKSSNFPCGNYGHWCVTSMRSKAFLRTMRKGSAIVSNVSQIADPWILYDLE